MCIVPGGTCMRSVPACARVTLVAESSTSPAQTSTSSCRAVIDGHLPERLAEFTANILLGILFLGAFKEVFRVPVFDEIAGPTAARGVDIHKGGFIRHAGRLLQIMRDDRNGVLF